MLYFYYPEPQKTTSIQPDPDLTPEHSSCTNISLDGRVLNQQLNDLTQSVFR